MKSIKEAEQAIAQILADLEVERGELVKEVRLESIEVTTFADDRPQWSRRVLIETERRPGSRWQGIESRPDSPQR